ncbi:MAG: hypothetical protein J6S96_04660 [Muribaculaceae bacterium]|nr:hypothetical protein [Muribaculaceae bacterium]
MILQITLLVLGILCLFASLIMLFYPRWVPAAVPAFVGLLLLHWSYFIAVPLGTFLFWGAAALMVWGIIYMSPQGEIDGKKSSNLYVGASAIAGALLGMIVDPRIMVLGVILGAFVGQLAYSRTPHGKWLTKSPSIFFQYFCAKCLPAIVAVSIIGIAIEGFLL